MLPCYATTPSGMTTMNIIKFGFALSLTNACLGVSLIATNTYDIPMQCLTSMISKILPIVQISFDVEKQSRSIFIEYFNPIFELFKQLLHHRKVLQQDIELKRQLHYR